jgi:hypothetical protein
MAAGDEQERIPFSGESRDAGPGAPVLPSLVALSVIIARSRDGEGPGRGFRLVVDLRRARRAEKARRSVLRGTRRCPFEPGGRLRPVGVGGDPTLHVFFLPSLGVPAQQPPSGVGALFAYGASDDR